MAYEGELVRMENGRWARYQSLRICQPGRAEATSGTILVAVELDEDAQELLRAAERSFRREDDRDELRWGTFRDMVSGASLH